LGAHVLLGQPDYVVTQVLILGTFLLLERAPRRRYTPWAAWALLTVASRSGLAPDWEIASTTAPARSGAAS
jgi:hypothetical protein